MCVSCHPSWAADSAQDCARNLRWCWRCWRRALQRSVRVMLTRPQMYVLGYRPAMIQRIELGASADGTLDAITHDAITVTSQYEDFFRQETGWSGLLYKSPNAKYAARPADVVRHALSKRCDGRLCARMRDGRACGRAQA
jgi:hypothetical protein